MSVSLNAVGTALGKVGAVTIAGATENAYTRTHAASGYRRINPFQAENGNAPTEFVAPHTLGDWAGYSHSTVNSGSDLEVTVGYGELVIAWVKPAGYSRAPSILTQKVMIKSMGVTEDLSLNPFSASYSTTDVGDGTTQTISATVGEFFAIGAKVEFDDSVATHTNADSLGYAAKAGETPLLGAGRGISSGEAVYATAPSISVVQLTDPATCLVGCTSCVDVKLNLTMKGTSLGTLQEQIDGGGWTTVDSAVPAGTTSITRSNLDAGKVYDYRMKYNDVSPETWSSTGSITTECTLL